MTSGGLVEVVEEACPPKLRGGGRSEVLSKMVESLYVRGLFTVEWGVW